MFPSIEKPTLRELWLMSELGGFDLCDLDSEMIGKLRAIAALEPIKGKTVLVTDTESRVYG